MKFNRKLSTKQFTLAILCILIISLSFVGWLHYLVNIEYQPPKNPFLRGPVTSAPKSFRMDLDQPEDNSLTFQPTILLSGKTTPLSDILVSSQNSDLVIKSKSDGSFSTILNLDEGENNIEVVIFDAQGESRSDTRTVYYAKEKL